MVVLGCAIGSRDSAQKPLVTIENGSGQSVDVFSERNGHLTLVTILQPGELFGSEPAGAECDGDASYVIQVSGREVARLDRPGCIGGTLVVTPDMLENE